MSTYTEHLGDKVRSRRQAVESHIKAVAAHAVMPLSESQLASHLNAANEKENNPDSDIHLRTITKSRLRRLGVHYSDDGTISSPIHRTEEEFSIEEDVEERPSARTEARSARLAKLAYTINHWEDDLSHPSAQKKKPSKQEQSGKRDFSKAKKTVGQKKITDQNTFLKPKSPLKTLNRELTTPTASSDKVNRKPPAKVSPGDFITPTDSTEKATRKPPTIVKCCAKEAVKRDAPNMDETPLSALDRPSKPKRIMWDSTIITSLEDRGFERCESREHLVYDFKEPCSPAKCLSPSRQANNDSTPVLSREPKKVLNGSPSKFTTSVAKPVEKPVRQVHIQDSATKQCVEGKASKPWSNAVASKSPTKILAGEDDSTVAKKQAVLTAGIVSDLTPSKMAPNSLKTFDKTKNSPLRHESPRGHSRSPSPRKNTQVLEMAAQFEEGSPTKKIKETDPSELPLSQRKALFEKNKGTVPLLPKAPLTMAVPAKALNTPSPKFVALKTHGSPVRPVDPSEDKLRMIREERAKEMQSLRNRWQANKNRNLGAHVVEATEVKESTTEPEAVEENHDDKQGSEEEEMASPKSTTSTSSRKCPHTGYPMLDDVRRIKISPPKPGHLYPSISDIETETETESEAVDNNNRSNSDHPGDDESLDYSDTSSVGSLGQTIVKIAKMSSSNLKRHNQSALNDTRAEEARVLGEIDHFLDEALGEPSPPKRSRESSFEQSLDNMSSNLECGSVHSDSFEFTRTSTSMDTYRTVDSREEIELQPKTQLVHTISLYRKQKEMSIKSVTTVKRTVKRQASFDESPEYTDKDSSYEMEQKQLPSESQLVSNRIHELLLEISKQQTIISQATQALNLCSSTIEFSGSVEQTEAERLLLIASQKRQALSHEVDRLRVEKRIHPNNSNAKERGDLTIHSITLPLKMDVIRLAAREERCHYVVILVRSGPAVVASEMLPALPKNLKQSEPYLLTFKTPLTLEKLYSDFTVTLEVYSLETRSKELLPHDIKYHITPSAKKTFVMPTSIIVFRDREKLRMTPKKGSKADASRLIVGPIESPGGPQAVRSSSFKLSGYAVFSLREINKTNFSLSKVQYGSVVEGSVQVKMTCDMSLEGLEFHGFLTMFQDVSGFGAWHRRWCYLKDNVISYWLYPEHEQTKVPLDTIDLSECCSEGDVGLVPRDVCARPNTFLLETIRPRLPSDSDSLVMKTNRDSTLVRHLLSADTKEDRLEWCSRINQCLSLLKAWGKRPTHTVQHTQL